MIRKAAADKLASDLLAPFIQAGVASESTVAMASRLIMQSVEIDELEVRLSELDKAIDSAKAAA